jgi:hypothetical protein
MARIDAPEYDTNDPRGWCGDPKRGAARGRPTVRGSAEYDGLLSLVHIRLDVGGHDRLGTYFGSGRPIYWYASADGTIDGVLRAESREDAKEQVKKLYPSARFYR